jgi:hypothetical protein
MNDPFILSEIKNDENRDKNKMEKEREREEIDVFDV